MASSKHALAMLGLSLALTLLPAPRPAAAQAPKVTSKIERVTLYRGQALVTRRVELEAAKGAIEAVVPDLPENIVEDSLFAEGGEGVEVRAVRYVTRPVGAEPREEVRKLDEEIEGVSDKIALNQKTQELMAKRTEYLDKLEGFVAPEAKIEVSKGVLNAEALEKITKFSFENRSKVATELVAALREGRDLQKQKQLLERKRAELTNGANRTVREAVLFLEARAEGKQTVSLSYLVSGCGWSPSYTYRGDKDRKEVRVEYNGLIQQMSGEDWKDVELTLSTASPALSATAPGLAPFEVAALHEAPPGKPGGQLPTPSPMTWAARSRSSRAGSRRPSMLTPMRSSKPTTPDSTGTSTPWRTITNRWSCTAARTR